MRESEKEGEAERKAANHVLLLLYLSTEYLLHGAQSSTFLLPDLKQTAKTVKTTIYQAKTEQHTARNERLTRVQL